MEEILKQILAELKGLTNEVKAIKKDHGRKLTNLATELNDHGRKLTNLETELNDHGTKLKILEVSLNGLKEEHGAILRAILESKEVLRGEIDALTHRTAKIEGTIKGAAKQVLEDLKEVSNR